MESKDAVFHGPVRPGHAFVLPEVFDPGFDQEGLHKPARVGDILKYPPPDRPVPPLEATEASAQSKYAAKLTVGAVPGGSAPFPK